MSSGDNIDFNYSDDEIDERKHQKLLDEVLTLNKAQQVKRASRTEPALKISEFDLVKSITGKKGTVHVGDLTKALTTKSKLLPIKKKLEKSNISSKTLPKPLEKPIADRIRRTVAYEKARLELDLWEPIVTSNRVSTNLVFPLRSSRLEEQENEAERWKLKTIFDLEEEKQNPAPVEEIHVDIEKEKLPMNMKEIMEHRREAAHLRAHQSYKEAKARRQNRIKSKNYHRLQKREKIKHQIKEFELLQKTDPEEALKKLEEIEKIRAQERFSLRHKSTGKWAKYRQIRAKYDKESRQDLAEQLTLSKELSQKVNIVSDSEEDLVPQENNTNSNLVVQDEQMNSIEEGNTWLNNFNVDKDVTSFVNNYKKFWSENIRDLKENSATSNERKDDLNQTKLEDSSINMIVTSQEHSVINSKKENHCENLQAGVKKCLSDESLGEAPNSYSDNSDLLIGKKELSLNYYNVSEKPTEEKIGTLLCSKKIPKKTRNKLKKVQSVSTSEWNVDFIGNEGIDAVFDKIEKSLETKLQTKLNKLEKDLKGKSKKKNRKRIVDNVEQSSLLSLPTQKKRPKIDEPLNETVNGEENGNDVELNDLKGVIEKKQITEKKKLSEVNVNSNEFKKMKAIPLNTEIPDILTNADDDIEDPTQQGLIAEALQDDNLIEEFAKDKSDIIEKERPKNIDLTLQGWGSWGGTGIVPSKRKKRRFIMKAPKKFPRRDDNKGFLIINEDVTKKTKEHMVADLPFPFQRVKDFEANMRAPIGRSFVPETAFQKLIKPAVRTKVGAIIEPMAKDVLLKLPK